MARKPRLYLPNYSYLILQQGNNLQPCFYDRADYIHYLTTLSKASHKYQTALHAFALINNKVLLLLTPSSSTGVSRLMQFTGSNHVRYMNKKYQRTGTLFQGRHKECVIETCRYLMDCMYYIDLFPFQNKLVTDPNQYPWSSFHWNTSASRIGTLTSAVHSEHLNNIHLNSHPQYLNLASNTLTRKSLYKERLLNTNHATAFTFIQNRLDSSKPIASDKFIEKIETKMNIKLLNLRVGRPKAKLSIPKIQG